MSDSNSVRSRRKRGRRRDGYVVLRGVLVHRDRFVGKLLDRGVLTEDEALDEDKLNQAAGEILAVWAE